MSYSITTADGITIDNIPDEIDSNSDTLKARVAELRKSQGMEAPKPIVEPMPARPMGQELGRQLGLTARAGITGAAGLHQLLQNSLALYQEVEI